MESIDAIISTFLTSRIYPQFDPDKILGVLLSGSYSRGLQNPYSDLDVHIVVENSYPYRQRGNVEVNNLLVEYNVNPYRQMVQYFKIEHMHNIPFKCTAVVEGKVFLEKHGAMRRLKRVAENWINKPYPPMKPSMIEFRQYQLADDLNRMISLYKRDKKVFTLFYFNNLKFMYDVYAKYLGQPILKDYMLHDYFTEHLRYGGILKRFPDGVFAEMFVSALEACNREAMMERYEKLTTYVLKETGGYRLKGWEFRLPVDYSRRMDTKTRVF